MKIKSKLLLINNLVITLGMVLGAIIIYVNIKTITENNIEKELKKLNDMYFSFVDTMVKSSISNYLKFKSQQYASGVKWLYKAYKNGNYSYGNFKALVDKLLKFENIGTNGYLFAMSPDGKIKFHKDISKINSSIYDYIEAKPNFEMKLKRLNEEDYLKYKINKKTGYLEFIDKSETETSNKNLALYMTFIKELNLIICAAAYKKDFTQLVDTDEIMKKISAKKSSLKNYFYILNKKGYMISHPDLFPMSLEYMKDANGKLFIKEMIEQKNGKYVYSFKNVVDKKVQIKIAHLKYLKLMDWVIAAVTNKSDLFDPIYRLRNIIILIGLALIIVLFVFILWASNLITKPIKKLVETINKMKEGDLTERAKINSSDEIGELAATFNSMAEKIQDYTKNLEYKVEQRTSELQEAYDEVKSLNEQQSGDYFLTSLLLNPLITKKITSDVFDIDFYLSQKKKFQFRKREGEIGGDINIAHKIELRGKKYIVFVNGDAMGKSLQGSGGAIVMGVVFNAFVARTNEMHSLKKLSPERWLIECYQELQSVFESFDGSMLISAVIGMVDEISGVMHYFNAEHPWNVIYKNGNAKFTQNELDIRKIGTVGFDNELKIRSITLNKGDVVFLGSDGRDDIQIGTDDETKMRIINEDETLFIKTVEKAKGEIENVINITNELGELTDDISIIKIELKNNPEWKNNANQQEFKKLKNEASEKLKEDNKDEAVKKFQKAVEIYPNENCLKNLALLYKEKNFTSKELEVIEKILYYYPYKKNVNYLYRASTLLKKTENFIKAAEYSEDFNVYFPDNVNNLINLADIYRLLKETDNAVKIIAKAKSIEPDNKLVIKLENLLNKKMN